MRIWFLSRFPITPRLINFKCDVSSLLLFIFLQFPYLHCCLCIPSCLVCAVLWSREHISHYTLLTDEMLRPWMHRWGMSLWARLRCEQTSPFFFTALNISLWLFPVSVGWYISGPDSLQWHLKRQGAAGLLIEEVLMDDNADKEGSLPEIILFLVRLQSAEDGRLIDLCNFISIWLLAIHKWKMSSSSGSK